MSHLHWLIGEQITALTKTYGGIFMQELIKVSYESGKPMVKGRELHTALRVETRYNDWFKRMCEYGFEDGTDFYSFLSKTTEGRPGIEHQLTIAMAKELCMLQRSAMGKQFRQYFIAVEEKWNSPEAVMARALGFAKKQLELVKAENMAFANRLALQNQQILELQPKASYYDIVLQCKDLVPISVIAKDYGWSAGRMNKYLHECGVQFKQGKIWLLYQAYAEKGFTSTKTFISPDAHGDMHNYVHTYWTQAGRQLLRVVHKIVFTLTKR